VLLLKTDSGEMQWFTPTILAIQDAEIGRIAVQSQPKQKVCETTISANGQCGAINLSSQLHREAQIG
jgi:hypothetical protein